MCSPRHSNQPSIKKQHMNSYDQELIDALIQTIETAENPESVTNEMVAAVMDFLNRSYKEIRESVKSVADEETERKAADILHDRAIQNIRAAIDTLTTAAATNKNRLDTLIDGDKVTQAIDTFNELKDFLEGVTNRETFLGLLNEVRENIRDTASVAESAVPKAVDVSDLDTMGTDGSIMAMRGLVVDAAHTRYCVTATSGQRARTVGYLDIMTDSGQHVLTQVLTTHYTFTPEGVLDSTSHTDSRIRTYFRSYGLSSGTVGDGSVPSLAWTSWREMVPETVAPVEVESEERLNAMLEAGELEDGRMYFVAEEE